VATPGEVQQEIGRAYLYVLIGCLERAVRHFEKLFDVLSSPEKVAFTGLAGTNFSFDAVGRFSDPIQLAEVFIESKGYADGSGLYEHYKEFIAKAYSVSVAHPRHRRDLFWFVTNVPFAPAIGARLAAPETVRAALTNERNERVRKILGDAPIDREHIRLLANRLAVCIFPDSFIRWMGISGDNLWGIIKLMHAGRIPTVTFTEVSALVARLNNIEDVDRIRSGRRLYLPWYGIYK